MPSIRDLNFVDMIGDDYVLILSGDHIYSMDYSKMLDFHKKHQAKVTIGTIRVPWDEASRFGIMVADDNMRITKFQEKPKQPESNLASMGIYIFDRPVLGRYSGLMPRMKRRNTISARTSSQPC